MCIYTYSVFTSCFGMNDLCRHLVPKLVIIPGLSIAYPDHSLILFLREGNQVPSFTELYRHGTPFASRNDNLHQASSIRGLHRILSRTSSRQGWNRTRLLLAIFQRRRIGLVLRLLGALLDLKVNSVQIKVAMKNTKSSQDPTGYLLRIVITSVL